MSRAVLSIGSNLGDRLGYLSLAVEVFRPWLRATSGVYETPAWGPIEQPNFLNAILVVDDDRASADTWLQRSQSAEQAAERTRELRWGPRTLDVDVIDVDGQRRDDPRLTLPHPRAGERAFVLIPWLEVVPDATLPAGSVRHLLTALEPGEVDGVIARPDLSLRPAAP